MDKFITFEPQYIASNVNRCGVWMCRYRNFRTFVAPEAVQFSSVAVDPSGDVVCAGSKDTFQMFVWSMRTGQLLDIFSGHEGPISSLKFNPSMLLQCMICSSISREMNNVRFVCTIPSFVPVQRHDLWRALNCV